MRDCIDVGCAPTEEDCAQIGSEDYVDRAHRECRAYIHQLRRTFGNEPAGTLLSIKSNTHDFGTYLSVVCYFVDQFPASVDYAFRCERESPRKWDAEARRDLAGEIRPNPS